MGKKIIYQWTGETVGPCKKCRRPIWFYKHPRTGNSIPVLRKTGEPHFADCPFAGDFRRKQKGCGDAKRKHR